MSCYTCIQENNKALEEKLRRLMPRFVEEAGKTFAVVKTINNSSFMWRAIGHPDCYRLTVVQYHIEP